MVFSLVSFFFFFCYLFLCVKKMMLRSCVLNVQQKMSFPKDGIKRVMCFISLMMPGQLSEIYLYTGCFRKINSNKATGLK